VGRKGVTSEADLIARCRAGDQEALGELVAVHHERVYRVAYALAGSEEVAQEIVQETLLKAWRGLRGFWGEAALGTWLTRLALNAGRDALRRERRRAALESVLGLLPWARPTAGVSVEERDELDYALRRLSPAARQVLALRYGLDLSISETAQGLGCPEGSKEQGGYVVVLDTESGEPYLLVRLKPVS
jgi:RNA polymerase sigma-70 factor (ECF subfamily)